MDEQLHRKLRKIANMGISRYQNEIIPEMLERLQINNKEELLEEPLKALKLFMNYCFVRGRADELSWTYCKCAYDAMDYISTAAGYEKIKYLSASADRLVEVYKNEVRKVPRKDKKDDFYKTNPKDEELLKSVFGDFLPTLDKHNYNVVDFVLKLIKEDRMREAYRAINKVSEVGDKIAAVFLRDIVCMFDLEGSVSKEGHLYLQPVDTWVRKVAQELWKELKTGNDTGIKLKIVDVCFEYRISPIAFNQGAWYLGAHAFDLILEEL
jgi:hypothetical protein